MGAQAAEAGADEAAWETEADADVSREMRLSGPILSQDEIDSLLGFAQGAPYERLPEIVLDRLVRLMTTSLRSFTSSDVELSIEQIASIGFGDFPDPIPSPGIAAVFRAGQTENFGLVTVDDNLVHSVVNVFRSGAPARAEGAPHTAIERTLATRMIEVVLADVREAFSPLSEAAFQLDRIATDLRFAAIAGAPDAAIVVKLRIGMKGGDGRLKLIVPYGMIDPVAHRGATRRDEAARRVLTRR